MVRFLRGGGGRVDYSVVQVPAGRKKDPLTYNITLGRKNCATLFIHEGHEEARREGMVVFAHSYARWGERAAHECGPRIHECLGAPVAGARSERRAGHSCIRAVFVVGPLSPIPMPGAPVVSSPNSLCLRASVVP